MSVTLSSGFSFLLRWQHGFKADVANAVKTRTPHGNASPHGWHNLIHDQLLKLILKNGNLPVSARRQISASLVHLRTMRESADYRSGHTMNYNIALECIQHAVTALLLLRAMEEAE